MNPITSATVSGLGQTPLTGAVEGTWVIGFFQDGEEAQHPIIMGTLLGLRQVFQQGRQQGFQDRLNANYPKYTETDMNRLAVNDPNNPHPSYNTKGGSYNKHQRADFNP